MIRPSFPPLALALLLGTAMPLPASAADISIEAVNAARFDADLAAGGTEPAGLEGADPLDRANASPG
jgi:hypothetical protein